MWLNRYAAAFANNDLLTLEAVYQLELLRRELSRALVAKAPQHGYRLRKITVPNQEVEVPELTKAKLTESLDGQNGPFERNCINPGRGESVKQSHEFVELHATSPIRSINDRIKRIEDIGGQFRWNGIG